MVTTSRTYLPQGFGGFGQGDWDPTKRDYYNNPKISSGYSPSSSSRSAAPAQAQTGYTVPSWIHVDPRKYSFEQFKEEARELEAKKDEVTSQRDYFELKRQEYVERLETLYRGMGLKQDVDEQLTEKANKTWGIALLLLGAWNVLSGTMVYTELERLKVQENVKGTKNLAVTLIAMGVVQLVVAILLYVNKKGPNWFKGALLIFSIGCASTSYSMFGSDISKAVDTSASVWAGLSTGLNTIAGLVIIGTSLYGLLSKKR
ncbi:MAG: hypothetical protein EB023_09990 [Flavobacteriia bacterium]|nr:hypothetical protein [Flavobacteriia bacterium]